MYQARPFHLFRPDHRHSLNSSEDPLANDLVNPGGNESVLDIGINDASALATVHPVENESLFRPQSGDHGQKSLVVLSY